jgi:outer membrane protein assembly factor BamB
LRLSFQFNVFVSSFTGDAYVSRVNVLFVVLCMPVHVVAQNNVVPKQTDVLVEPLLQALRGAIGEERWLDAAQSFDSIWQQLQDGEDQVPGISFSGPRALHSGAHQAHAGARAQLRDVWRTAPSKFRKEYQRQFDGLARQQLQDVLQRGNRHSALSLVKRYEYCDSSVSVAKHLVSDAMARGDSLSGVLMLRQLQSWAIAPTPQMEILLADVWLKNDFEQEARLAIDRLADRVGYGATVNYSGHQLRLPESAAAVSTWLANELSPGQPADVSTWLQPLGDAARRRSQSQQSVRLAMAWRRSVFRTQIDSELNQKLEELDRRVAQSFENTPISPTQPIVTDDLVVFQGVGSLQAVSRSSGKHVWESNRFNRQLQASLQSSAGRGLGSLADISVRNAPRNHVRGQLACDGEFLFCVEETTQGLSSQLPGETLALQDRLHNVLRVYDVNTGRLRGQAGGLDVPGESGQTALLTSTCFLGTPLLLHGRILILAEDSQGIHLLELRLRSRSSAADSELEFEIVDRQLLSVPLFALPVHPLRRYAGISPSFGDGLLICHGCDEQVLALSADDLSIEWVHRYRANVRPKELGGGGPIFGNAIDDSESRHRDIASRPHDSIARVSGSNVLLMPRDADQLICLDLYSGQELWSRPRADLRYVAALTDSTIVLAGETQLIALRLTDGSSIWQQEFVDLEISAQPAATDRLIYLPTQQGHLVTIDTASGRRLLRQSLSDVPLGNLLSIPGQLIAQSSAEIASWHAASRSGEAPLIVIEESLLQMDPENVIPRLVQLVETSTGEIRQDARSLLTEQMLESVRLDYDQNRKYIPLLRQMIAANALTPAQIAGVVQASLGLTLHDAAVFSKHWDVIRRGKIQKDRLDHLIVRGLGIGQDLTAEEVAEQGAEIMETALLHPSRLLQIGRVRLLAANQTAATMQMAISRLDGSGRQQAIQLLRPTVQQLLAVDANPQLLNSKIHFFWMAGLGECLWPLSELVSEHLFALSQSAMSVQLLASETAGWLDVPQAYLRLNEKWGGEESVSKEAWPTLESMSNGPGNDSVGRIADVLQRQRSALLKSRRIPRVTASDAHTPVSAKKFVELAPEALLPLYGTPGVFRGWHFVRMNGQSTIVAIDELGQRRWELTPTENGQRQSRSRRSLRSDDDYAMACGRLLALKDGDQIYMLNTANVTTGSPQVLWRTDLNRLLPAATSHQRAHRSWERTTVYDRRPHAFSPVGPLTEIGLPLLRGHRLMIVSPWTGQPMWTQEDVPDDTRMTAQGGQLCLISESTSQIQVRNLRDGSVLQTGLLPPWWTEGNALYDTSVKHVDPEEGLVVPWRIVVEGRQCLMFELQPTKATLKSYDMASVNATGPSVAWQADLPFDSVFSNVSDGLVATLSDGNHLQIRQIEDGTLVADQSVPLTKGCERLYLRRSHDRWLVLTYAPHNREEPAIVMNAVPVNGAIYAIDSGDGSLAWTGAARDEYLRSVNVERLPTLPSAPLLVLLSRKLRRASGRIGSKCAARILDVHNGDVLYEDDDLGTNLSWHALRFDGDNRFAINFERRAIEFDFSADKPE